MGPLADQKVPKRNDSDDVIEVPDPKASLQQSRPQNIRQPSQNSMPQITPEMFAKMPPEQKQEIQRRMGIDIADQGFPGSAAAPSGNHNAGPNAGKDNRLSMMIRQVEQATPARPIVPMSPRTRSRMIEGLQDKTGSMVHKIEQYLPIHLSKSQDYKQAMELLRMVCSTARV